MATNPTHPGQPADPYQPHSPADPTYGAGGPAYDPVAHVPAETFAPIDVPAEPRQQPAEFVGKLPPADSSAPLGGYDSNQR